MESFLSQNQGILLVEQYFTFTALDIYWSLTQGAYFSRPTRLAVAVFSPFPVYITKGDFDEVSLRSMDALALVSFIPLAHKGGFGIAKMRILFVFPVFSFSRSGRCITKGVF
jgi:hypothetical protein